jgi:hypothetical protein
MFFNMSFSTFTTFPVVSRKPVNLTTVPSTLVVVVDTPTKATVIMLVSFRL